MIAYGVALVATLGATACVKEQVIVSGSVGPSLVVEQFVRAAGAKDYAAMGRLFGTKEGPIASKESRSYVEQRMATIAAVLRHQDFELMGEESVPGRMTEATKLTVRMTVDGRAFTVPYTLVRYKDGWLVEQIGLEVLTAPR